MIPDYTLLDKIYEKGVKSKYFDIAIKNNEKPIAFILGGQSGSGKSVLAKNLDEKFYPNNFVTIDVDELRQFNLEYTSLMKSNQFEKVPIILSEHTTYLKNRLLKDCIDNKVNILIDTTFAGKDVKQSEQLIYLLKTNNYSIHLNVLAVKKEISRMGNLFRYENQLRDFGYGRRVELNVQDEYYKNLPLNLNKALDSYGQFIDKFSIYKREVWSDNGVIKNNQVRNIYSTDKQNHNVSKALEVFQYERIRKYTSDEKNYFLSKVNLIEKSMFDRKAPLEDIKYFKDSFKEFLPKYKFLYFKNQLMVDKNISQNKGISM